MYKPIYNKKYWVLGSCDVCGQLAYVEPHGITTHCRKCGKDTEHSNIPYQCRDVSGCYMVRSLSRLSEES